MADYGEGSSGGRGGRPWWHYAGGGCCGCLVVAVLAMVAGGFWLTDTFRKIDVGPVTPEAVQKSLGDLPLYPGAKLDTPTTENLLRVVRMIERASRRKPREMFRGLASLDTQDDVAKVAQFYRGKLREGGWLPDSDAVEKGTRKLVYEKGREVAVVQLMVHDESRGTSILLVGTTRDAASLVPTIRQDRTP